MSSRAMTIFYVDDDLEDLDFFKEVTSMIDKEISVYTHIRGEALIDALKNPPPSRN